MEQSKKPTPTYDRLVAEANELRKREPRTLDKYRTRQHPTLGLQWLNTKHWNPQKQQRETRWEAVTPVDTGAQHFHTFADEFDYRDPDSELEDMETGKALAAISELGHLTRMLLESSDFFVGLTEEGRVWKTIRRRNPEFLQGESSQESATLEEQASSYMHTRGGAPEVDPEDAMAGERCDQLSSLGSQTIHYTEDEGGDEGDTGPGQYVETPWSPPKERWDLLCDEEAVQPDGGIGFSAKLYPSPSWQNTFPGRVVVNGKLFPERKVFLRITQRLMFSQRLPSRSQLFHLGGLLKSSRAQRRVWEIYRIEEFIRAKHHQRQVQQALHPPETLQVRDEAQEQKVLIHA